MNRTINLAIAIAVCFLVAVGQARAEVKVPAIFSHNMVLQRDVPLRVWGQAAAGEKVTVSIGDASDSTTADEKGVWANKMVGAVFIRHHPMPHRHGCKCCWGKPFITA